MGTLYLIATPIGNLDDITLRAIRTLGEVSLIAAEDTRSAKALLTHLGIAAPAMTSYTDHASPGKTASIVAALDAGDVGVVSDAGMPGISDPGHDLVVAAIEAGHRVVPIPGASAVVAAVAASGLPSRRFHYVGFLPRKSGARRAALVDAARSGDTIVVYESPHRVLATLTDARAALGDRRIAVARELTKLYEEIWRGTISEALAYFVAPRGEFTLIIQGGSADDPTPPSDEDILSATEARVSEGMSDSDAIAAVAEAFGLKRRDVYRLWHRHDAGDA